MYPRACFRQISGLVLALTLAACSPGGQSPAPNTDVANVGETEVAVAATEEAQRTAVDVSTEAAPTASLAAPTVPPTETPTSPPSPTASPTLEPTPTASPAPTAPPTPTADPWATYAPYTIEGLRGRSYGEGAIEILEVMEETPAFTRYLIAYPSDGLRITGMMNRPRGDGPFPVVILNHGYYPLDVYQTGNGSQTAADYLAAQGFLAIAPDFRSHAGSDDAPNLFRAGHVIDALNLVPLAQRLPEAQPGKVGMWGHSNGGAITAKVVAVTDQIGAAVIYAPASSNIVEDYWFRVERAQSRGGQIDPIEWPVKPEEGPDLYERLSPLPYLHYVQAPVMIHYGTIDEVVPLKWPEDLRAGLEAAGKPITMHLYEGQPHSFYGEANQLYLQRTADFFRQHLSAQPAGQ